MQPFGHEGHRSGSCRWSFIVLTTNGTSTHGLCRKAICSMHDADGGAKRDWMM